MPSPPRFPSSDITAYISEGVGSHNTSLSSPILVSLLTHFALPSITSAYTLFWSGLACSGADFGSDDSSELSHSAREAFESYEALFARDLERFAQDKGFTEAEVINELYRYYQSSGSHEEGGDGGDGDALEEEKASELEARSVVAMLLATLDPTVFFERARKEGKYTRKAMEDAEMMF